MTESSFRQRFGLVQSKPIDNDFPESARVALAYLFDDLLKEGAFGREVGNLPREQALRAGRLVAADFNFRNIPDFFGETLAVLKAMQWWQVFSLCETLYRFHITETGFFNNNDDWVVSRSRQEWQADFSGQLNEILSEENIAYQFIDGQFQRRGRAHTQKMSQKVGVVLGDARLQRARNHFKKAKQFFEAVPNPDLENCVKEAICSLEACLDVLTGKPAKDFANAVKDLRGNGPRQIPPPIAESIIKVNGYRGSGQGVAHAALDGNRVDAVDAELVLNLVAAYITYLYDLLVVEEEIPF